jgi:hypothetical protein
MNNPSQPNNAPLARLFQPTVEDTTDTTAHAVTTGTTAHIGGTTAHIGTTTTHIGSTADKTYVTSSGWPDTQWTSDDVNTTVITADWDDTITIGKLKLGPDAELLNERLARIETALGIATRLPTLESTYTELHEAGENMDHIIKHARHIYEVIGAGNAYTTLTKECEIMEKLKLNNDTE